MASGVPFLPANPTFGSLIGQALGGGLDEGISEGITQQISQFQKQKEFKKQESALNKLGIKVPEGFSFLPEKIQSAYIQDQFVKRLFENQDETNQDSGIRGSSSENLQPDVSNQMQGVPNQSKSQGLSKFTDEQLQRLVANPIYGKIAEEELKSRREVQKDIRKSDIGRSNKFLDQINDSRGAIQRQESSLLAAEQALGNRNLGFFSRDNLAQITGIQGLASREGAVFNAAAKNFFLADLETAVGRPNQFLEKILTNAIFANGKSNEANQALLDFYKNQVDLEKEKIKITDNLEDYYRNKLGYVPGNIGRLVDQQLKPYAQQKEKELVDRFKDSNLIKKTPQQGKTTRMTDPSGAIRDVPNEQVKAAEKEGYKLSR